MEKNTKLGMHVNIYLGPLPGPWKGSRNVSFISFMVNLPLCVGVSSVVPARDLRL